MYIMQSVLLSHTRVVRKRKSRTCIHIFNTDFNIVNMTKRAEVDM